MFKRMLSKFLAALLFSFISSESFSEALLNNCRSSFFDLSEAPSSSNFQIHQCVKLNLHLGSYYDLSFGETIGSIGGNVYYSARGKNWGLYLSSQPAYNYSHSSKKTLFEPSKADYSGLVSYGIEKESNLRGSIGKMHLPFGILRYDQDGIKHLIRLNEFYSEKASSIKIDYDTPRRIMFEISCNTIEKAKEDKCAGRMSYDLAALGGIRAASAFLMEGKSINGYNLSFLSKIDSPNPFKFHWIRKTDSQTDFKQIVRISFGNIRNNNERQEFVIDLIRFSSRSLLWAFEKDIKENIKSNLLIKYKNDITREKYTWIIGAGIDLNL